MKIAVLDGYALNPGDLSWEPLRALGECHIYERTRSDEIPERARDAEIILTNKTGLPGSTLASLPRLRYIGVLATGYDVVDVAQATRQNIVVTNVPEYGTAAVAQMVFGLLLELWNHTSVHAEAVRRGEWSHSPDWCFWVMPRVQLSGKTLGVVGYGRTGRSVASIGLAFGMKVMVTGGRRPADMQPGTSLEPGIRWAELDELLAESDVISLHCPLNSSTRGLINAARLKQMKWGAVLINTARGGLLIEEDVANALESGQLSGACLDVLTAEPPAASSPLIGRKNCLVTPHIAWATCESRERLLATAVENIRMWIAGRPQNVVNVRV